MRVMLVAGARPNFMKVAPLVPALERAGHEIVLVHTGQHYDAQMSGSFFQDLGLPAPQHSLGAGSGTHAVQTARVMQAFEPVLLDERPDWVVVPGDVNSTLGCALVTVKLKGDLGARLAHLEAGLRSHDWRMPEEVNRVLTDRCSDLLLTPSTDAAANLHAEGLTSDRIAFVGNLMIDSLFAHLPRARGLGLLDEAGLTRGRYVAATLHRPSNVDHSPALRVFLEALGRIARHLPVVLPLHPRTRASVTRWGLDPLLAPLRVCEPLGYTEMLSLTDGAAAVLTDSGGLQEETSALGIPCVTLREQTERPVTIQHGTNRLVPWPPTVDGICATLGRALAAGRDPRPCRIEGWDGRAAARVVAALESASESVVEPHETLSRTRNECVPAAHYHNRDDVRQTIAAD